MLPIVRSELPAPLPDMAIRTACALAALLVLVSSCRSGDALAQEPVVAPGAGPGAGAAAAAADLDPGPELSEPFVPAAPRPWTGAFSGTAVLLAERLRIEGPPPLLEHVVASSDKELYDRRVTTTADGLVQVVRRRKGSEREVRVQLDRWSLAAHEEVVIVETAADGPVRVIASGDAVWRDLDAHQMEGQELQFSGAIGDDTPFSPPPGGRR